MSGVNFGEVLMEPRHAGMLCPVCRVDLVMSDRQGIEIDYCPKCRGVWLDRGELDKIIEKTAAAEPSPQYRPEARPEPDHRRERYYDDDDKHRYGYGRRKKSLLGEIFDF
jgi:Zn-finger nucleic acid-binding protein